MDDFTPLDVKNQEEQPSSLLKLDEATRFLAEVRNVDDVKALRDKAEAMRVYAKQAKLGLEAQNYAAEIKLRAERRAGELLAEAPKNVGTKGQLAGRDSSGAHVSRAPEVETPTLKEIGITYDQSSKWQRIAQIPEAEFEAEIVSEKAAGKELTTGSMLRTAAAPQRREQRVSAVVSVSSELGTFPVIYADPPWRYEHVKTNNRAIENQYPTMTLEDICALRVHEIAAQDSVLFLWATSPKLAESIQVITSWGFIYRTCLVWVKDKIGMGYYARQQHELLLIAARGALPVPEVEDRLSSVIFADRGEHSAKPVEFYERIELMYPEYRRIELFSRNKRDGWEGWGNQYDGS